MYNITSVSKDEPFALENRRRVSLTSVLCKMLEHSIVSSLSDHQDSEPHNYCVPSSMDIAE